VLDARPVRSPDAATIETVPTLPSCRWLFLAAGIAAASAAPRAEIITHGARGCGEVALTFDLCPVIHGAGLDAPLVKELIDRRIPATFFMSGAWMAKHDAAVRELLGVPFFEIGTHGEAHAHLPALGDEAARAEILGPVRRLQTTYHREATLFRPPYGEYTDGTVRVAAGVGQRLVLWSIVSGDPDPALTAASIERDVESRLRPGSVVIFHANGRGWHTAEVVAQLASWLAGPARALAPVTISTLLQGCGHGPGSAARH
jgi:peptidoglycan/xylan/chitin deacetylase (PgdA/CDA1 family)